MLCSYLLQKKWVVKFRGVKFPGSEIPITLSQSGIDDFSDHLPHKKMFEKNCLSNVCMANLQKYSEVEV